MLMFSMSYVQKHFCHGRGRGFEPRRPRHTFQMTYGAYGPNVTSKSGFDMGAVRNLPPILRVFFILHFTQIWNHHLHNLALCGPASATCGASGSKLGIVEVTHTILYLLLVRVIWGYEAVPEFAAQLSLLISQISMPTRERFTTRFSQSLV